MENRATISGGFPMATPGTYYTVDGEPSIARKDLAIKDATLPGLVGFVKARADVIKALSGIENDGAHVAIDRENQSITLNMREHGGSKPVGMYYSPATTVVGSARFSEDHLAVKEILKEKYTPLQLAETIQRNRHLFQSETDWEKLRSTLASMKFQIDKIVENTANDSTGKRKNLFQQDIVGQQPMSFTLNYAMHVGEPKVDMKVDILFKVEHTTVDLHLIAINMIRQERDAVNALIDKTLGEIKKVLGENALPYIELNPERPEDDDND